jgi:hypothetical protein
MQKLKNFKALSGVFFSSQSLSKSRCKKAASLDLKTSMPMSLKTYVGFLLQLAAK